MTAKIQNFINELENQFEFGSQQLLKARALASELKDDELKLFCISEINGEFEEKNFPAYRIKRGQPIGVFKNSLTGQIQEIDLDYSRFLKMINIDPSEAEMRKIGNPVIDFEDFYKRTTMSSIKITYTKDMLDFIRPYLKEDEKNGWILIDAYFEFPFSTFKQILDSIKAELFDHLIRLKSIFTNKSSLREVFIESGNPFRGVNTLLSIFENAKKEIVLVDGYVNKDTFSFFEIKNEKVVVKLITDQKSKSGVLDLLISLFNNQFGGLTVEYRKDFHDRFLIIDQEEFYSTGASIKDIGKKHSMITKIEDPEIIKNIKTIISGNK